MKKLMLLSLLIFGCEELLVSKKEGCTISTACNYDSTATKDDGSCLENDCGGECDGEAAIDSCGLCTGGTTGLKENYLQDCAGVCGGYSIVDCAGVCGGSAMLADCASCGDPSADNYISGATQTCDDTDVDGKPDCCTYGADNDPDAANAKVEEANEILFDDLNYVVNQDPPEEFDVLDQYFNMTESYELYSEALELDTENVGAHFGLALTELATFTQDQRLYDTMDDWIECLDDLTTDDISPSGHDNEGLSRSKLANQGFLLGMPVSSKAFYAFDIIDIINYLPIITSYNDVMLRSDEICPEIDSIQDLVENVFLNRLSIAISHMDKVVGTGFTFTITPDMLEDEDQTKIELDDTIFYLMKALMHQLRAFMYVMTTYNMNVPYYDFAEAEDGRVATDFDWQWLAQDADFLTIRSGQENSFPTVHADLNNVVNSIESAWTFLKADTETYYDIIDFDDICEDEDECDNDINEVLEEIRAIINEEYEVTIEIVRSCTSYTDNGYYYENCISEEVDITLDIGGFLQAPPQNLKEIIPNYSIATGNCTYEDREYENDYYNLSVSYSDTALVNGKEYNISGNCHFDNYGNEESQVNVNLYNYNDLSDNIVSALKILINNACSGIISNYTSMDKLSYFNLNFNSYIVVNNNTLEIQDNCYYTIDYNISGNWGAPIVSWEATTCDQWKSGWDVTIGGLFPNMTQTKLFDAMMKIEDEPCEDEILNIDCEDY